MQDPDTADPLTAFGWDATFQAQFDSLDVQSLAPARVVAQHRNMYVVVTRTGESMATLAGRLRHDADSIGTLPSVGDWIGVVQGTGGRGSIRAVLPRRSAFVRKVAGSETAAQVVAANIDVALVVTAAPDDINPRRLERYLALVWESGAQPVIVLNKVDQCPDIGAAVSAVRAVSLGVDVIPVSATTGAGVDALRAVLHPTRTAALLGSSGVGKSTLANRLLATEHLVTGAVRDDGRGRHTTTHRELVRLATGALLIDTPGMRELQLWNDGVGVSVAFSDIESLSAGCRFADCTHAVEPDCAVRAAADGGHLPRERLEHWHKLQRELAHLARRQDAQAASVERAHIKSIHRAARIQMRRKYK
jgi:ribosome biogenesis GTPase / thiamine phosphate phosphatase